MDDRTITLVAKQPLTYAGRDFIAGDVFLAKPIDAAVFTYRRVAGFAPSDAKPTPGILLEPTPEPEPETPRRRRRYRTRQMKAEA